MFSKKKKSNKINGIKDTDKLKDEEGNPIYDTNSGTSAYKQAETNFDIDPNGSSLVVSITYFKNHVHILK